METSQKKEIWIAINTTWNIFNFRSGLVSSLKEAGFDVVAYSPSDEYVERIERLGLRHVSMQLNNAGTQPLLEAMTLWRMIQLLRRERPALLLTYTPKVNIYLSLAARICGIPVITNVSGLGRTFISGNWLTLVTRFLYRIAFAWPGRVFFQNSEDRELFVKAKLVRRNQTELLPGSGVDVERFSPRPRYRHVTPFVFLMVSRMLWDKGVGEYVCAARQVKKEFPNVKFRLLGFLDVASPSAVKRSEVEAWVSEGTIDYLGSSDDMVPFYADVDCVVLPSYREGMPKTLLEAAAMGLPVIATDVPGCREAVIHGKTGLLCEARNSESLAESMRRMLLLSLEERVAMGRTARERIVREFDERIVIGRYLSVVKEMLG